MSPIGSVHFTFALAALLFGALVTQTRKGSRIHRWLGWGYVWSMLSLNVTALVIYRLLGTFGPFHAAAIFSVITVIAGMVPAYLRPSRWKEYHGYWMSWSYVGLCAAAVAETWTRFVDRDAFWGTVIAATVVVLIAGKVVIGRTLPAILNR